MFTYSCRQSLMTLLLFCFLFVHTPLIAEPALKPALEPAWKPDFTLAKKLLKAPTDEIESTFSNLIPNVERADYALLVSERLAFKYRDFTKAKIFLEIAEKELQHQKTAYQKIATLYMFRMSIAAYKNDYKAVVANGKITLSNLRKNNNASLKRYKYVLNKMSDAYYTIGDFENSLKYAEQLVSEAQLRKNSSVEAGALYRVAFGHYKLSRADKAEPIASKAYDIYKKLELNNGIGDTQKLLGNIYISQKKHEKAKSSYDTAISYYKKSRNHHGIANTKFNTGIMLKIQKNYGEAIIYLEDASFHFMESGSASGSGMAKMELGKVYFLLNELNKTEILYDEARVLLQKTNSINRIAQLERYYASYYLKLNQKDNAKQAYIRSLKIYRDSNNTKMVKRISKKINKLKN